MNRPPATGLTRVWIWFWYSDITRFAILFGIPLLPLALVLHWLELDGESIKNMLIFAYITLIGWALVDNDYSNLRRIGLDEYRHPVKPKMPLDTGAEVLPDYKEW